MRMSAQPVAHSGFDFLSKAALVLFTFQIGALAHMILGQGMEDPPKGYLFIVMITVLFASAQRRLAAVPIGRGAAAWMTASRTAALAMLVIVSLLVVFRGLFTPPAVKIATTGVSAALWAAIALKGAAAGKFKPGGRLGLRVYWTTHSRLAWERAHRVLGRVLFWGGLAGLATSFVIPTFASLALWCATVALAVSLALVESRRSWRNDPDRLGSAPNGSALRPATK
jgi:uncharacterized membrane protein